jgi:hypothetical protein
MLSLNISSPAFSKVTSPRNPDERYVGDWASFLAFGNSLVRFRLRRTSFLQLRTLLRTRLREVGRSLTSGDNLAVLEIESAYDVIEAQDDAIWPYIIDKYESALIEDLPAVGIQLQVKNRDFWDTYDRQSAEAQFRFGIALPSAVIIIIWAIQSSNYWWLLLLVMPLYFLILGFRQAAQANATLVQAVVLKIVEPPILERLREYVAKKTEEEQKKRAAEAEQLRKERQTMWTTWGRKGSPPPDWDPESDPEWSLIQGGPQ